MSDRTRKIPYAAADTHEAARRLDKLLSTDKRQGRPFAIVTSVSPSGMSRTIRVLAFDTAGGSIVDVSYRIAVLLDLPYSDARGFRVDGCGMDTVFHALYGVWGALRHRGMLCSADLKDYSAFCSYTS